MRHGYNPAGSFSEQLEYLMHDEHHCRGICARHPDITVQAAEERRAEAMRPPIPLGRHARHRAVIENFLPTAPGTQISFNARTGPCWNCRLGPRRWFGRTHWNCRPPLKVRYMNVTGKPRDAELERKLDNGTDA